MTTRILLGEQYQRPAFKLGGMVFCAGSERRMSIALERALAWVLEYRISAVRIHVRPDDDLRGAYGVIARFPEDVMLWTTLLYDRDASDTDPDRLAEFALETLIALGPHRIAYLEVSNEPYQRIAQGDLVVWHRAVIAALKARGVTTPIAVNPYPGDTSLYVGLRDEPQVRAFDEHRYVELLHDDPMRVSAQISEVAVLNNRAISSCTDIPLCGRLRIRARCHHSYGGRDATGALEVRWVTRNGELTWSCPPTDTNGEWIDRYFDKDGLNQIKLVHEGGGYWSHISVVVSDFESDPAAYALWRSVQDYEDALNAHDPAAYLEPYVSSRQLASTRPNLLLGEGGSGDWGKSCMVKGGPSLLHGMVMGAQAALLVPYPIALYSPHSGPTGYESPYARALELVQAGLTLGPLRKVTLEGDADGLFVFGGDNRLLLVNFRPAREVILPHEARRVVSLYPQPMSPTHGNLRWAWTPDHCADSNIAVRERRVVVPQGISLVRMKG